MDHQLFGTIETSEGVAAAQICIDVDLPDEWFIQWYGEGITSGGVLVPAKWTGDTVTLGPVLLLYKARDTGGLFAPPDLSDDEVKVKQALCATLTRTGSRLTGTWTGVDGQTGKMEFAPPSSDLRVQAKVVSSWSAFKAWADAERASGQAACFRGHGCNKFSLRTTLHRAGLYRLDRYRANTLAPFAVHAQVALSQRFDLNNSQDYSTIIGLAQHYGVPTPLLDWTASPYVAAFFAFSDALDNRESRRSTHVRVYVLSQQFINSTSPNIVELMNPAPFTMSLLVLPLHNPRLYAQQGRFVVTNVGNVERFVCDVENRAHVKVLTAVDIPIDSMKEALSDLQFMGLTAATMYPGLEGIGRMLKHQMLASLPRAAADLGPATQEATPHALPRAVAAAAAADAERVSQNFPTRD